MSAIARWPDEAQQAIDDLIVLVRAYELPYSRLAKAKSIEAAYEASSSFPEDEGTAADLVRARLGLPALGDK